jgi:hypothetical protein
MNTDNPPSENTTLEPGPSTCSEETDASKTWPEVARLGDRIVHELGLSESDKTLARWMAHRIAELQQRAANAVSGGERVAARRECADLILRVWTIRRDWPSRSPFSAFLPLLEPLVTDTNSYHWQRNEVRSPWVKAAHELEDISTQEWRLCLDAMLLDTPRREIENELRRCEDFYEEVDEDEKLVADRFRAWPTRVLGDDTIRGMSAKKRRAHYVKVLKELHDERQKILTSLVDAVTMPATAPKARKGHPAKQK